MKDISVGAIVKVKFGNKNYSAKVLDLLSWKPGKRKSRKRPGKENVSFLEIYIRGKPLVIINNSNNCRTYGFKRRGNLREQRERLFFRSH